MSHPFSQILARLDEHEKRLATLETKPRLLTLTQAAAEAGYSYSRFKNIRTRFGFKAGETRVLAADFYKALARERGGDGR